LGVEDFKEEVRKILGTEIKFDGHINQVMSNISENRQKSILEWVKKCKQELLEPTPCKNFRNLMSFIYKSNDNRIRGILIKEKGSYFIELFLDKHVYYDRKRKYLGI
jgi:hypothetical protein